MADSFKQISYWLTISQLLEIHLWDSNFSRSGRVQQINGFWLIAIVRIVSNRSPLFQWNISSNSWNSKWSVFILGSSYCVCTILLFGESKIRIRLQLFISSFSSNALGRIPCCEVIPVAISKFWITWCLSLTKVFDFSKLISCNGFHVFNDFLNNDRFWISVFNSFMMDSLSCTIQQPLLSKSETVSWRPSLNNWVCIPIVFSISLLSRVIVAVSSFVHFCMFRLLIGSTATRIKDIFSIDTILSWETKGNFSIFSLSRPNIFTSQASSKRFSLNRLILTFHNIIELVC